jgi:hypothetical protein
MRNLAYGTKSPELRYPILVVKILLFLFFELKTTVAESVIGDYVFAI